jgi:hypothetical protein
VNNFSIEIPNERIKTYKVVTFIMLTLNFLGFGYVFLRTNNTASIFAIIALVLNAVPWLYYLLNKKHIKSPIIEITLITSAFLWMYFGNFWMGIIMLFFAAMSFFTNKKQIILFNEEGIIYPSFPVKKYAWAEVAHVIWKDDILTIDLKDNKLLQFNIEKGFAEGFDVVGFNGFCRVVCNYENPLRCQNK